MRRVHAVVEGRVQGVGYRWFVVQTAEKLEIKGWVRNCSDGSVEVSAEGEEIQINKFISVIRQGPALAEVYCISVEEEDYLGEFSRFNITR